MDKQEVIIDWIGGGDVINVTGFINQILMNQKRKINLILDAGRYLRVLIDCPLRIFFKDISSKTLEFVFCGDY